MFFSLSLSIYTTCALLFFVYNSFLLFFSSFCFLIAHSCARAPKHKSPVCCVLPGVGGHIVVADAIARLVQLVHIEIEIVLFIHRLTTNGLHTHTQRRRNKNKKHLFSLSNFVVFPITEFWLKFFCDDTHRVELESRKCIIHTKCNKASDSRKNF